MDIEKLKTLEGYAHNLSAYTADLVELEMVPDLNIPAGFENREEYRLHLGSMIRSYRILLGIAYNDIDEWRNV